MFSSVTEIAEIRRDLKNREIGFIFETRFENCNKEKLFVLMSPITH